MLTTDSTSWRNHKASNLEPSSARKRKIRSCKRPCWMKKK